MTEIGLGHYLTLGAVIFSIGIIGIFKNIPIIPSEKITAPKVKYCHKLIAVIYINFYVKVQLLHFNTS